MFVTAGVEGPARNHGADKARLVSTATARHRRQPAIGNREHAVRRIFQNEERFSFLLPAQQCAGAAKQRRAPAI